MKWQKMDKIRAERIAKEVIGSEIGGWKVLELINYGKSAVVFKAEKSAALKIFDRELVERFGEAAQAERINRELSLRGKKHENLVEIFDGGKCLRTGYYFIVMTYIDAPNLASVLSDIPREQIWSIISQVARAAHFLESLEIAHRDIKPENIAISIDYRKAVLLDLGVIRPFKVESLTDAEQRVFLGTLRYSSPEFLFRKEENSLEGWRALTFYQLGAVLHDMIMQRCLFDEFSDPFAMLVEAVKHETPVINATDVSPDLVLLARNCLSKPVDLRLRLLKWEDFEPRATSSTSASEARERVRKRKTYYKEQAKQSYDEDIEREIRATKQIIDEMSTKIQAVISRECISSGFFPPIEIHDFLQGSSPKVASFLLCISSSEEYGLKNVISILFLIELLEQKDRIVSLNYVSGLYNKNIDVEGFKEQRSTTFFEGAFEEAVIKNKLRDILYLLFDKAQQSEGMKSNTEILREPEWITIDEP